MPLRVILVERALVGQVRDVAIHVLAVQQVVRQSVGYVLGRELRVGVPYAIHAAGHRAAPPCDREPLGAATCAFAEVDGSDLAVRRALLRLKKKGALATPFRGFHVIVPPEYRFLGGEYGQAGDPDAFAAKLRQVLSSSP